MKYFYIILSIIILLITLLTLQVPELNATNLWIIFLACTIASIYYDFKNRK